MVFLLVSSILFHLHQVWHFLSLTGVQRHLICLVPTSQNICFSPVVSLSSFAAAPIKRKGFFEFTVLCPEKTTKGFQLIKIFNYLFHIVSFQVIFLTTSERFNSAQYFWDSLTNQIIDSCHKVCYMLQFLWKVHFKFYWYSDKATPPKKINKKNELCLSILNLLKLSTDVIINARHNAGNKVFVFCKLWVWNVQYSLIKDEISNSLFFFFFRNSLVNSLLTSKQHLPVQNAHWKV